MADNQNYAALEWVIGEIDETLKLARQALEEYVENPEDTTRIRFCLTHIHQVHGSLQMVQFVGAALLAEEMEVLAQALMNRKVADETEALELMMQAILKLPLYLEQVKTSRKDDPATLLPLLNDLRAVRGSSLVSETRYFNLDVSPSHRVSGAKNEALKNPAQLKAVLQKLRQMYQYAAAGYIRGVKAQENLEYLAKVFYRMKQLTKGTQRQPLWEIAQALIDSLEVGSLDVSVSVKSLLRQLDKEIKVLIDHGVKAFDARTRDNLIKNLLYYVARSTAVSPRVQKVQQEYDLRAAVPEENTDSNMQVLVDPETMKTVVVALQDELETIKHALDIGISGRDKSSIDEAIPVMQRVADTFSVLGIVEMRTQVLGQIDLLSRAETDGGVDQNTLMQVASEIIAMEQRLKAMTSKWRHSSFADQPDSSRRVEINQAQQSVLREARNGLDNTKEYIIEYIASQWDLKHIVKVPALLSEIRGGLSMIPLSRPAVILKSCSEYIEQELVKKEVRPDWNALDTLADAISSIEYYLERLVDGSDDDEDALLIIAEESVASLGYAIAGQKAVVRNNRAEADAATVLKKIASVETVNMDTLPEVMNEPVSEEQESIEANTLEDPDSLDETNATGLNEVDEDIQDASQQIVSDIDQPEVKQVIVSETKVDEEDEDEIDEEILEIFVEEATEVLEAIDEFFPLWAKDFEDIESLQESRRAFHTLKGSGRMVRANDISELAWSVESMLNQFMEKSIEPNSIHVKLIDLVRELLPDLIKAFESKLEAPHKELIKQYMLWGQALSKGDYPDELQDEATLAGSVVDKKKVASEVFPEDIDTIDEDEQRILWDIFVGEALTHLDVVEKFIAEMELAAPLYSMPSEDVQRALHTLKGSAHMADLTPIAQLVTPLETFAKELRSYMCNINYDILQLLKDGAIYIHQALDVIRSGAELVIPKLEQYKARVAELRELSLGPLIRQEDESTDAKKVDPELLSIFMSNDMDILLDTDNFLLSLSEESCDAKTIIPVIDELDTLANGAEQAAFPKMNQLSILLSQVYLSLSAESLPLTVSDVNVLAGAHEELLDMVDSVAAGQNLNEIKESTLQALTSFSPAPNEANNSDIVLGDITANVVVDELLNSDYLESKAPKVTLDDTEEDVIDHESNNASIISEDDISSDSLLEVVSDDLTEVFVESSKSIESPAPQEVAFISLTDDVDLDILEIFQEEAEELMEEIEQFVHDWEGDASLTEPAVELKRVLHTLKGGARLSGMMGVGDVAHDFETYLISFENKGEIDQVFFARVHQYQDALLRRVEKINAIMSGQTVNMAGVVDSSPMAEEVPLSQSADNENEEAADVQIPNLDSSNIDSTNILTFQPKDNVPVVTSGDDISGSDFQIPVSANTPASLSVGNSGSVSSSALAAKRSVPQEVIKVSAELLEELVNLAGETSISRGRTEEQLSEMGFTIEEMDSTINRLQEQLRRLDIETEAQVLFRQEQMEEVEDFDPLEMDRYSKLQQLSRSLIESASDLLDLKSTLSDRTRDTETLLLQQSRINTELQEGLMRSRMVQFSRMVPRLRRIIRQVSSELGKKVNFELENIEGEMDRTVLERMVAPLEHMLRNAVDHGIELPEERLAAGKPEFGRVILMLGREGGDVILRLIDNGKGINLKRVRDKAIERGFMTSDANLSDRDIMQFILHAGFSTAEAVTQISGRGVGLDVVSSEIKQLGGALLIDSKEGEGTEFTVRLPFTVSVNRALMIRLGDDRYAVPLNTIEGIVRVSPFELEHYYQNEDARFEYAGEQYQVRYLGALLHTDYNPKLEGQAMPLPVILVRTATNSVAIQVDMLMGSREIVVKSLGPQFGLVQGVSGATVMGDGSVVVIVDPHALIRTELALEHKSADLIHNQPEDDEAAKTVMVVDDSVTVRKVTSRVLERKGYEVLTAKDGVDALMVLQDHMPDVMLLDIEMPRMDGFEVAKNIRLNERLKDLPIIMITSRTGDKHREHAFSLGVNKYMGKPFQEEILLDNIESLIGSKSKLH